jgi:hypothetical protein
MTRTFLEANLSLSVGKGNGPTDIEQSDIVSYMLLALT